MSIEQLRSNLHVFLNDKREFHTVDGLLKVKSTEMSLLSQLRLAITSGAETNGSSSGGSAFTPVALNAFSLLQDIETELSDWYSSIHGINDKRMQFEVKLRSVANHVIGNGNDVEVARFTRVTANWIASTKDLLSPVKKAPLHGVCPVMHCGADRIPVAKDGGTVMEAALWFYGTQVYCHGCSSVWSGHTEIIALKVAMDAAIAA